MLQQIEVWHLGSYQDDKVRESEGFLSDIDDVRNGFLTDSHPTSWIFVSDQPWSSSIYFALEDEQRCSIGLVYRTEGPPEVNGDIFIVSGEEKVVRS